MDKRYKYILDFAANTSQINKEIGGLKGTLKSVGIAAAAYFSVDAVLDFGKAAVAAYNTSIQSETALLTALKGRTDVQQHLIGQAAELMGKTLYDDDEIVRAQSLVAAFVKEEEKIKTLIPLIQDMATAKQMDLAGAADLVTKTLAGEMNALGRYGIKVEGAAGSAERLKMITDGLSNAFKGQAEAAAKVGTGALTQLKNEYGNLEEAIGRLIIASQNQEGSFVKSWTRPIQAVTNFAEKVALVSESSSYNFIQSIMGAIGMTDEKATKLKERLAELHAPDINPDSLYGLQIALQKLEIEYGQMDASDKNALITQKQKIDATKEQIQALQDLGKVTAEANKYAAGSVGALGEELTKLNEQLANTNSTDLTSIQIIGAKIAALEKYKAAIENVASDPQTFRTDKLQQVGKIGSAQVTGDVDISKWSKELGNMNSMLDANQAKVDEWKNSLVEKAQTIAGAFEMGFNSIGQSIVGSLGLAQGGFEGFLGGMASMVADMIAMFLAQSISAAIAAGSISAAFTGAGAIFTSPAFIAMGVAGVLSAFAAIPAFAEGGIAYGPTLGLMGEYPGASSNPEVIAPLSKLKSMIGGGGGNTVILQPSIEYSGDRMRIMLNRVNADTKKRTGRG